MCGVWFWGEQQLKQEMQKVLAVYQQGIGSRWGEVVASLPESARAELAHRFG